MYRTVNVDIDVDLSEFDTDDLVEELEERGHCMGFGPTDIQQIVEKIWQKRRLGCVDYQADLDQLIYHVLGRVI